MSTCAMCPAAMTATAWCEIERDAKIPGEMVERAEREDAESRRGSQHGRRDAAHRAVAAGSHHDRALALTCWIIAFAS